MQAPVWYLWTVFLDEVCGYFARTLQASGNRIVTENRLEKFYSSGCFTYLKKSLTVVFSLRHKLQIDTADYRKNYATSVEDISCTCLLCNQAVRFMQKSMETHLKKMHNQTLIEYEKVETVSTHSFETPF
jgi:hypothetical protein